MRYFILCVVLWCLVGNGELYDFEKCVCHSSARKGGYYCGFEISTSDPNCLTNAVYQCVNGPNKLGHREEYCIDRPCIRVRSPTLDIPECYGYESEDYHRDFAKGAAPKCEGCFLRDKAKAPTYADHKFFLTSPTGFSLFQKTGNKWTEIKGLYT